MRTYHVMGLPLKALFEHTHSKGINLYEQEDSSPVIGVERATIMHRSVIGVLKKDGEFDALTADEGIEVSFEGIDTAFKSCPACGDRIMKVVSLITEDGNDHPTAVCDCIPCGMTFSFEVK